MISITRPHHREECASTIPSPLSSLATLRSQWKNRGIIQIQDQLYSVKTVSFQKWNPISYIWRKAYELFHWNTYTRFEHGQRYIYVLKSDLSDQQRILTTARTERNRGGEEHNDGISSSSTLASLIRTQFVATRNGLISSLFRTPISLSEEDNARLSSSIETISGKILKPSSPSVIKENIELGLKPFSLIALRQNGETQLYLKASKKNIESETLLGEGTFKKVVKVVDLSLNCLAALAKSRPRRNPRTEEDSEDVVHDMKETSYISSPDSNAKEYSIIQELHQKGISHIIKTRAFQTYERHSPTAGAEKKSLYITEYKEGKDLSERYQEAVSNPQLRKKWALQICSTVDALHQKGNIAHLDLKPMNILTDKDDNICLIDFEFYHRLGDRNIGMLRGTSNFFAPEWFGAKQQRYWNPNEKYDAWAVGHILMILRYGHVELYTVSYIQNHSINHSFISKRVELVLNSVLKENDQYDQAIRGLMNPDPRTRMSLREAIELLQQLPS